MKGLARVKKNLVFRTESCSPQSRKIPTVKGLARVNFFLNRTLQSTVKKIRTVKGLVRVFFLNRTLQSTVKKNSNCERFSSGQLFFEQNVAVYSQDKFEL